jgi:hypothetical protein
VQQTTGLWNNCLQGNVSADNLHLVIRFQAVMPDQQVHIGCVPEEPIRCTEAYGISRSFEHGAHVDVALRCAVQWPLVDTRRDASDVCTQPLRGLAGAAGPCYAAPATAKAHLRRRRGRAGAAPRASHTCNHRSTFSMCSPTPVCTGEAPVSRVSGTGSHRVTIGLRLTHAAIVAIQITAVSGRIQRGIMRISCMS